MYDAYKQYAYLYTLVLAFRSSDRCIRTGFGIYHVSIPRQPRTREQQKSSVRSPGPPRALTLEKNMSVRRPPKNFRDLNSSKFLRERFLAWRARAQTTSSFLKQASKRRGPRKRRRVLHFSTLQATKRKVSSKISLIDQPLCFWHSTR